MKSMENYDAVLEFFKNATEPVSAGQVAAGTGLDRKEVDKIMNKMKKEGTIVSPKRCYWEIKK
jgi:biotin operon repressor